MKKLLNLITEIIPFFIDIRAYKHAAILAHAVKGADVRKLTLRPLTGIDTLDSFASYA